MVLSKLSLEIHSDSAHAVNCQWTVVLRYEPDRIKLLVGLKILSVPAKMYVAVVAQPVMALSDCAWLDLLYLAISCLSLSVVLALSFLLTLSLQPLRVVAVTSPELVLFASHDDGSKEVREIVSGVVF